MTETDNSIIQSQPKQLYMIYDEKKEMELEQELLNYHKQKNSGYWKIAKMIVEHSSKDKTNTDFFLDSMDNEFIKNKDTFENIEKVFYKNELDIDIVYEFDTSISKYIIENLKIFKFKPDGYLFKNDINHNKFNFTITIITSKNSYTINRYINENQMGFFN
jgi:hypothetical protein|tara:strand:+ start:232 stop:714 length:483 start_codon:yes stop_codon:yes gene_type:complete